MLLINALNSLIVENRNEVSTNDLPSYLYHVSTNYSKVINSGVLLAKSGLDSGGLGGTESVGVSLVVDENVAKNIFDELVLINNINSSSSEHELLKILENIPDSDRRDFVLSEYERNLKTDQKPKTAALMALRLSRISLKFYGKPFHGIIIFKEENIKNKDIGIVKINKNNIPADVKIIEGADTDFGEIRVLGDIPL